jgi:hypothetical protein
LELQLGQPRIGREQYQADGFRAELSQADGLCFRQFATKQLVQQRLKLGLFRCGAYRTLSITPRPKAQA